MDGSMFNRLPVGKIVGFAIFGFIVALLAGLSGLGWLIWFALNHVRII